MFTVYLHYEHRSLTEAEIAERRLLARQKHQERMAAMNSATPVSEESQEGTVLVRYACFFLFFCLFFRLFLFIFLFILFYYFFLIYS